MRKRPADRVAGKFHANQQVRVRMDSEHVARKLDHALRGRQGLSAVHRENEACNELAAPFGDTVEHDSEIFCGRQISCCTRRGAQFEVDAIVTLKRAQHGLGHGAETSGGMYKFVNERENAKALLERTRRIAGQQSEVCGGAGHATQAQVFL